MGNGSYIEVYADILFLVCLVPEAVSLWLIAVWRQDRSRGRPFRLLGISALSAALSTAFMIVLRTVPFPVHVLLDLLVQLMVFRLLYGKLTLRGYGECYILQKVIFLLLGGSLTAGRAWGREHFLWDAGMLWRVIFGVLAGGGLLYTGLRHFFRKRCLAESLYEVEIVFQGKSCRCQGSLIRETSSTTKARYRSCCWSRNWRQNLVFIFCRNRVRRNVTASSLILPWVKGTEFCTALSVTGSYCRGLVSGRG